MSEHTKMYPLLSLHPDIEKEIRDDKQHGKKSKYAFADENIIRREDIDHDRATLVRSAFERDSEKIINIPAYNRYVDKTQVFSFIKNDDICRRGLHVQLVARVARSICSCLGLNTSLAEAIALGHDLGHAPFGHVGERLLNACYHKYTGRYFNHNVQSVRVMDTLYRRNISLQTLNGALCHNGEFVQKALRMRAMNTFDDLDKTVEKCISDEQNIKLLRPCTLEGCVVRMADMIAYLGKDRNDAIDLGIIPDFSCFSSQMIGVRNGEILNNMIVDIINNSYGKDHIEMSQEAFNDIKEAKKENYRYIYELEGQALEENHNVAPMFEALYDALYDDLLHKRETSTIYRHHIDYLCKKSQSITRESYLQEDPHQIVVDYISSMTDDYFVRLYNHTFPRKTATLDTATPYEYSYQFIHDSE